MKFYHICNETDRDKKQLNEPYAPESLKTEGFIHLSTKNQLSSTYHRYYAGKSGLIILEIILSEDDPKLVFEDTTGRGEVFPHLYREIQPDEIMETFPISEIQDF